MKTVRIQISVTDEYFGKINWMMGECGFKRMSDLLNSAVTLFRWAIEKRQAGFKIVAVDMNNDRIVEFDTPALSNVQQVK